MSLIARIATSVSAYAVSSSSFVSGRLSPYLVEHLDAGHLRHPLVRGHQGERAVPQRQVGKDLERLGARGGADDAVLGAVP